MTTAPLSLTSEELSELRNALETHYQKLFQLYGGQPNNDWTARRERFSALRTKLVTAEIDANGE